jgi:hypothetical protein
MPIDSQGKLGASRGYSRPIGNRRLGLFSWQASHEAQYLCTDIFMPGQ